jgi:hypothetical protein
VTAASRPEVSVVAPLFDNASTVAELCRRIHAALGPGTAHEIVLVVDGCERGSREAAEEAAREDDRVRVVGLSARSGQHAAVLAGLAQARGEWVVVMDADLQDPPEAVPALLAARGGHDAVFAIRAGDYEGRGRLLTGAAFRAVLSRLGRVPRGAGMFCAMSSAAAARVLSLTVRPPYVVAMVAHVADRIATVPVTRQPRRSGRSAYSSRQRLAVAVRALRCAARLRAGGHAAIRPSPAATALAIGALAAAYYAGQVSSYAFGLADEGYLFYVADAINHGRTLFRDVQIVLYPPELFHAFALVFRVAGRSIAAARLVMALFLAATTALSFLVARRLAGRVATAAATVTVCLVPGPWHKFYVAHFFLLVLAAALWAVDRPRAGRLFALGAAVGACLYFRLDAFVVGLAVTAIVAARPSLRATLRPLAFAAAGFVAAALPLAIHLGRLGLLGSFARQLAGFGGAALARSTAAYRLMPPRLADVGLFTAPGVFAVLFYGSLAIVILFVASAVRSLVGARRATAVPGSVIPARAWLVLFAWVLGNVPQYAIERPDLSHLTQRLPALLVASLAILAALSPSRPALRVTRWATASLLAAYFALLVGSAMARGEGGTVWAARHTLETVRLSNGQAFLQGRGGPWPEVVERVLRGAGPGEPLATLPYLPGVNFLAARPLPGRHVYLLPSVMERGTEDEYIASLERGPVRDVVLLESFRLNLADDTALQVYAPRVAAYLATRYVEVLRLGGLVVLRRGPEGARS